MTASITRSSASGPERAVRFVVGVLFALFALLAHAESVIRSAEIVPGDGGYVLNADIEIDLNPRLIDAVTRGVSLYFTTEVVIERPRWYWLNETVARRSLDYRLYYHAITRSYRLSVGNLHQNFDELDAALRTMQRVRNWLVAETDVLQAGVSQ